MSDSEVVTVASSPNITSLFDRIAADNKAVESSLIRSSPSEATPLVRDAAERKLLSLTSRAIDITEDVMENGQPRERLGAALAILDRSPATKPKDLASLGASITLPASAVESLITGLGSLFKQMNVPAGREDFNPHSSTAAPPYAERYDAEAMDAIVIEPSDTKEPL